MPVVLVAVHASFGSWSGSWSYYCCINHLTICFMMLLFQLKLKDVFGYCLPLSKKGFMVTGTLVTVMLHIKSHDTRKRSTERNALCRNLINFKWVWNWKQTLCLHVAFAVINFPHYAFIALCVCLLQTVHLSYPHGRKTTSLSSQAWD